MNINLYKAVKKTEMRHLLLRELKKHEIGPVLMAFFKKVEINSVLPNFFKKPEMQLVLLKKIEGVKKYFLTKNIKYGIVKLKTGGDYEN